VLRHELLLHDITEGRMKGKATRRVERPDEKQKLHGNKTRSSKQSKLESYNVINLLVTAD